MRTRHVRLFMFIVCCYLGVLGAVRESAELQQKLELIKTYINAYENTRADRDYYQDYDANNELERRSRASRLFRKRGFPDYSSVELFQ